jgi:Flp pilus assembly protein TadG
MCKRAGRRGNTFLELALVLVPWMALILGITDFGFAIFLRNAFQHSVREGVRYAVTYQTISGMGHDASIKSVVQRNSVGMLAGASGAAEIHIRYYLPDTLVETPNNWPGNLVEVSIENYQWRWMAPLLRTVTPMSVTVRSMDRMEGLPGGTLPPAR